MVSNNKLTLILKIIYQHDIKHIMTLQINIISDLKVTTTIITTITAHPIRLAAKPAIMSVSTSYLLLFYIYFSIETLLEHFMNLLLFFFFYISINPGF